MPGDPIKWGIFYLLSMNSMRVNSFSYSVWIFTLFHLLVLPFARVFGRAQTSKVLRLCICVLLLVMGNVNFFVAHIVCANETVVDLFFSRRMTTNADVAAVA